MTGQLLKVTSTSFQAVRISQNARLVPSDSVDLERRKALARMKAFQSKHSSGGGNIDISYVNKINRTFSANASHPSTAPTPKKTGNNAISDTPHRSPDMSKTANPAPSAVADMQGPDSSDMALSSVSSTQKQVSSSQDTQTSVSAESNSAYTMDRGAFEFRVATGDLSFLPPLTMTIIVQQPEVHFEYLGGYHYVPASLFEDNGIMNLSV
ncbi:MAG: hypothetical protein HFI38_12620 [Lachnospiraceae bacterium]|nr:hypothetical protein [Lachnospiraceae bacterium]